MVIRNPLFQGHIPRLSKVEVQFNCKKLRNSCYGETSCGDFKQRKNLPWETSYALWRHYFPKEELAVWTTIAKWIDRKIKRKFREKRSLSLKVYRIQSQSEDCAAGLISYIYAKKQEKREGVDWLLGPFSDKNNFSVQNKQTSKIEPRSNSFQKCLDVYCK